MAIFSSSPGYFVAKRGEVHGMLWACLRAHDWLWTQPHLPLWKHLCEDRKSHLPAFVFIHHGPLTNGGLGPFSNMTDDI